MNKREMLETRIYIKNKYLVKQLSKMFNRFKSKHVDKDNVWFVISKLYSSFWINAKELGLVIAVTRKYNTQSGTVVYILFTKE